MKNLAGKILWTLATILPFILTLVGSFVVGDNAFQIYFIALWWMTISWLIVLASAVLMWLNKTSKSIALYFVAIIFYDVVMVISSGFASDSDIVSAIGVVFIIIFSIVPAIKLLFGKNIKSLKSAMVLLILCTVFRMLFGIASVGIFLVTPLPFLPFTGFWPSNLFPLMAIIAIGLCNKSLKKDLQSQPVETTQQ